MLVTNRLLYSARRKHLLRTAIDTAIFDGMSRRCGEPDQLAPLNQPTWLVVQDAYSRVLDVKECGLGRSARASQRRKKCQAADGWAYDRSSLRERSGK